MLLFALAGLSCRSEPHRISSCAALKTAPAHDVDCPKSSSPWDQHPWDFKRPGRYTDLPAESVFAGFDGLDALLEDDFDDFDLAIPDSEGASSSGEYCKVSREVRNACHTPVSLDPAPDATLVAISRRGATLTGISRVVVEGVKRERRRPQEQSDVSNWASTRHGQGLRELALALTGTQLLQGSKPYSSCYGGHQFGHWAGQLGDGRVATLGEIKGVASQDQVVGINKRWAGGLLEIQLKGIGKTPFSRGGDGKAVLRACLQEYLFSEAFSGLGLPAAVVVSVCSTGECARIRDSTPHSGGSLKKAPGAVLCRAAPSFLRFGSFELPARRGEVDVVRTLANFCLTHLRPILEGTNCGAPAIAMYDGVPASEKRPSWQSHEGRSSGGMHVQKDDGQSRSEYLELLLIIVQATAKMVAGWQALGFCHGVLNTDNFTLLGLTLDFGPCSFMENYDPTSSPNESDSALRYTFQNQPDVAAWNCERLAEAFSSLIGGSAVAQAYHTFADAFDVEYTTRLERKLGLTGMELGSGWVDLLKGEGSDNHESKDKANEWTPDGQFVMRLLHLMSDSGTDFTNTWQALADVPASSAGLPKSTRSLLDASMTMRESDTTGLRPPACTNGHSTGASTSGSNDAIGSQGGDLTGTHRPFMSDEEILRPLLALLVTAKASSTQRQEWAVWTREYMARIDSQGIGRTHPGGTEEGRQARLAIMRANNPTFILRTAALQRALEAAEQGDMRQVTQIEQQLSRPYSKEWIEEE